MTSPTAKTCKRHRRAFTLIEMAIVMLIIGILASVATPKFATALTEARVDAAAKRIVADLRLARSDAQLKATTRSVQFVVGNDRYTLSEVKGLNRRDGAYQVDLSQEDYPTTIAVADFNSNATVQFDWRGRPSDSGTVTVQSGGYARTIEVNAAGIVKLLP